MFDYIIIMCILELMMFGAATICVGLGIAAYKILKRFSPFYEPINKIKKTFEILKNLPKLEQIFVQSAKYNESMNQDIYEQLKLIIDRLDKKNNEELICRELEQSNEKKEYEPEKSLVEYAENFLFNKDKIETVKYNCINCNEYATVNHDTLLCEKCNNEWEKNKFKRLKSKIQFNEEIKRKTYQKEEVDEHGYGKEEYDYIHESISNQCNEYFDDINGSDAPFIGNTVTVHEDEPVVHEEEPVVYKAFQESSYEDQKKYMEKLLREKNEEPESLPEKEKKELLVKMQRFCADKENEFAGDKIVAINKNRDTGRYDFGFQNNVEKLYSDHQRNEQNYGMYGGYQL